MTNHKLSRRGFLKITSMTAVGAALAACAPAAVPSAGDGGGASKEAVELVHTFWGSPEEMQLWVSFDEQFTETNEGVSVVSEHIPQDYDNQILLRQAAGDMPEVLNIQDEPFPKFADRGAYTNLDPWVERDSGELNLDDFFPNLVAMFQWDSDAKQWLKGSHYALPWDGGEILWYYNKRVFEEAGIEPPANNGADWTLDDFVDISLQLAQHDADGNMTRAAFLMPGAIYSMPFIYTMGGQYIDLETMTGAFNTPEAIAALEYYTALVHEHHVAPLSTEMTGMGATDLFREGQIGMHLTGPWWFPDLRAIPPEDLEFDVLHVPSDPATGLKATRQSWDGMAIGDGVDDPDAAWDYIKFVLSTEGQTQISLLGRAMPARPSVAATDAFINPDAPPENEQVFSEGLDYAVVQPVNLYWSEMNTVLNKYWEQMLLEDIQLPPAEAAVKIDDALDALFANGELPAEW